MDSSLLYPKLRWPLDVRFERIDKQEVILISCPLGLSSAPLALMTAVGPVLSCFQGNQSLQEIAAKFSDQGLTIENLNELVALLDQHLFLASPRFFAAQNEMVEDFKNSPDREAALAGLTYSLHQTDLSKEIDGYLNTHKQNGALPSGSLLALKSPHIDYRRGSAAYGITYNYLRNEDHDLYILIGTSHQHSRHLFHLTRKNFNTPLGKLNCDVDFVDKLALKYGSSRSYADEILHKKEHSLELQTPFICRLKKDPKIAPILVGSFHNFINASKYPEEFPEYNEFAAALTERLKEYLGTGKKFCFIAGVDMAHIGNYFGDSGNLNENFMKNIEKRDKAYLMHIENQDKHALFQHIAEDNDIRKICGFPTMYLLIDVIDRLGLKYRSQLFDYRQAVNYKNDCAVTFAGMGLYV